MRPETQALRITRNRRHDEQRRLKKPWRKWYKSARWYKLRALKLSRQPTCARCARDQQVTPADTVHHVVPHRGDEKLFFDYSNLESICKWHHDSEAQSEERTRFVQTGVDGWPL